MVGKSGDGYLFFFVSASNYMGFLSLLSPGNLLI